MRDHTLEVSKFHHQASFVSKILRICTLSGWVLGNNLKAKLRHFPLDNSFPGNRKFKCSASAANIASQLIMNAKTNLFYFLTIGPLQLAIHVVQNRYAGELGRGALGQDKQTAHFIKVVISYVCLLPMRVLGCLPFLWTKHSVGGLSMQMVSKIQW